MTVEHLLFSGNTVNTIYHVNSVSNFVHNKGYAFILLKVYTKTGYYLASCQYDAITRQTAEHEAEEIFTLFH